MPAYCQTCHRTCHPETSGLRTTDGEPICGACARAIVLDPSARPGMDASEADEYQRRVVEPLARRLGVVPAPPPGQPDYADLTGD